MSTSIHCSLLPDWGHNMISHLVSLPPSCTVPCQTTRDNKPSFRFLFRPFCHNNEKTTNALSNSSSFKSNHWAALHRWQDTAQWQVPWNITMHPMCVHILHMWVHVCIHATMLLCRYNFAVYAGHGHFQPEIQTLISTLTYLALFYTLVGLALACLVSSYL